MVKNWRVTLEREDGTYYVRDERAACLRHAMRATLAAYEGKYGRDGAHVQRVVEIKRRTSHAGVEVRR